MQRSVPGYAVRLGAGLSDLFVRFLPKLGPRVRAAYFFENQAVTVRQLPLSSWQAAS